MATRKCRACIEPLENRAYATLVSETSTTQRNSPTVASVQHVYKSNQVPIVSGMTATLDGDVLRLQGTYGDESVNIRAAGTGVRVSIYSVVSYRAFTPDSPIFRVAMTTTTRREYLFNAAGLRSVVIDGSDGSDSVRSSGLNFNPAVASVEAQRTTIIEASVGETPSDTIYTGFYSPGSNWYRQVRLQQYQANRSGAKVAFFGDSHAALFPTITSSTTLTKYWRGLLQLGIPGDGTRQMITRVRRGLFDTFKPEKLIVSVGDNNFSNSTDSGTDAQVHAGVLTLIRMLRAKLPNTKIVLVGLLPRPLELGVTQRVLAYNEFLSASAADNGFTYLNVYDRFIAHPRVADGAVVGSDDHYTKQGYKILSYMLMETLQEIA